MMKKLITGLFLFSLALIALTGCEDKVIREVTYTANTAVYMPHEVFRSDDIVQSKTSRTIENPGKIYYYNDYLFINEVMKGVHIIDNSTPSAPQKIAFVEIPGNIDLAVIGDIMYADSYTDLLAIDISNPNEAFITGRIENSFEQTYPEFNPSYPVKRPDKEKGVVIGWEVKEITETTVMNNNNGGPQGDFLFDQGSVRMASNVNGGSAESSNSGSNKSPVLPGLGGSMAKFTLYGDHLYTIDVREMKVFDISSPSSPAEGNTISLNWESETIYPYDDKLFIGTVSGMLVYDLQTPASPQYVSEFWHATSCDPVVVKDNYAYVTLRSGNNCGNFNDQLDVVDISDISNPFLAESYMMSNPHGLGISGNTLFICDGTDGLKIYDASDAYNIDNNMIAHFTGISAYDVIPYNNVLMTTSEEGIYQYDYSDLQNIKLLSKIEVGQ